LERIQCQKLKNFGEHVPLRYKVVALMSNKYIELPTWKKGEMWKTSMDFCIFKPRKKLNPAVWNVNIMNHCETGTVLKD
jgi:hypothetical protein